jgi:hypothetical protein
VCEKSSHFTTRSDFGYCNSSGSLLTTALCHPIMLSSFSKLKVIKMYQRTVTKAQTVWAVEISVHHEMAQELEFKELIYDFATLKAGMMHKKYCIFRMPTHGVPPKCPGRIGVNCRKCKNHKLSTHLNLLKRSGNYMSLNSINHLIFVMVKSCVFFAVRTEFLNTV